jgi:hypothetical protein
MSVTPLFASATELAGVPSLGTGNSWPEFIAKMGVPAAIALFLVYSLSMSIGAQLRDIRASQILADRAASEFYTMMGQQVDRSNAQRGQMLWSLQAICLHASRTSLERDSCISR